MTRKYTTSFKMIAQSLNFQKEQTSAITQYTIHTESKESFKRKDNMKRLISLIIILTLLHCTSNDVEEYIPDCGM